MAYTEDERGRSVTTSDIARALALHLCVGLMLLVVSAAHAQESEDEGEQGAGSQAQITSGDIEDPTSAEARRRFQQGIALARAGNCQGALAELRASFELLPRPNTMFNIAQCEEELHRYDLALASYERYLSLAEADAPDRASVERTMRTLGGLLGTIHIESNVPAEVWLDDRVVGTAPGDVLVPGGSHVIELRADGRVPARREVVVAAQARVVVDVALEEVTTHVTVEQTTIEQTTIERHESPPLPLPVFVSGIVLSVGALAVGTGFGVSALLERDRQRALHPALPRDPSAVDDAALYADAFFITGAILVASTFAIAFLTDFGGGDETASDEGDDAGSVSVAPMFSPTHAGLSARGSF